MPLPADFDSSDTYTTRTIAKLLGIPSPTIHGWVARGEFVPVGKRGKANLFSGADVIAMEAYRKKSAGHSAAPPARKKSTGKKRSSPIVVAPVVVAAIAKVTVEACTDGFGENHVFWEIGKCDGGRVVEDLTFGPIDLPVITDNTEQGQGMVPMSDEHYIFDSGEAVVLANALDNAEATWIYGPSGSGKTSGAKQMCHDLNWPMYRINMNGDFSVADFVGTTEVVIDPDTSSAVTEFVPGPLINAMVNGGVLLIDEFSATPAHILLVLQAVLERVEDPHAAWEAGYTHTTFTNTADGGRVIHAHPRFRIIVTDNTNGQGDVSGAYAGTNVMNEATRSRFTQWLHKGYPAAVAWRELLRAKTGCDADIAKQIVGVAIDVNKGSALLGASTVTSQIVVNPRDTLAVARLARTFGDVGIAFRVGIVNSMNPEDGDRSFLVDLIKAKLGK